MRANRLAFGRGPTDLTEGVAGFVVRHARNFREGKGAGGGGEEEVLSHLLLSNVLR